ncbi:MAG: glycosyltransferase, partial [Chloroflexi bacterium]|nr:glycosyltransferase [Chloroflexota bacterium]
MNLHVLSLQGLPGVRDYRMCVAALQCDPTLRYTVLVENPDYYRRFEGLGHLFAPIHIWRTRSRATWIDKLRYYFLDEIVAGQRLKQLVAEFQVDIVHTQNLPHLAYYAVKYTNRPVVHDVSDFYSIFPRDQESPPKRSLSIWRWYKHQRESWYERYAFENCEALTFNSPHMLEAARGLYNIRRLTAVIPNAVPEQDIPRHGLPKLSHIDHNFHLVFVGHINRLKLERLSWVADRGFHVHLYTYHSASFEPTLRRKVASCPFLHYHGALPYQELLVQLTQYDYGLVLWYKGAGEQFFQVSLPGKLFDYLASGLPVVVGPYRSMVDFVQTKGCGFVLRDINELEEGLAQQYSLGDPKQYTMEHYIPALL